MNSLEFFFEPFFRINVKRIMYDGIEATMKMEAAHVCAMALSAYTEILGGYVTGKLKEQKSSRANYEAFLPYLGDHYVRLNYELNKRGRNLHSEVRSKLIHEFNLRISFAIQLHDSVMNKPGLEYVSIGDAPRGEIINGVKTLVYPAPAYLNFNLREYYRDFQAGVEKYYSDLAAEEQKEPMERRLFTNFMEAFATRIGSD